MREAQFKLTVKVEDTVTNDSSFERAILRNIVKYHIVPELENLEQWTVDHLSMVSVTITLENVES